MDDQITNIILGVCAALIVICFILLIREVKKNTKTKVQTIRCDFDFAPQLDEQEDEADSSSKSEIELLRKKYKQAKTSPASHRLQQSLYRPQYTESHPGRYFSSSACFSSYI